MTKRKLRNKLQFVGSGKYKYNIKCSINNFISSQQPTKPPITLVFLAQQLFLQNKFKQTKRKLRNKLQSIGSRLLQHKMQHHYSSRSMQQQPWPKAIVILFCRTNFSKSPLHVCADSESRNLAWLDLINY